MSNNKMISVGIIGAGSRARGVYWEMRAAAGEALTIASFFDTDPAQAGRVRELPGGEKAEQAASPEQVINNPAVTAVMIGSPNAFHTQPAVQAMESGKPLYLEKPLATTAADHKLLLETYRRTNARVVVGFVLRYTPFYRKVKELTAEIGRILFLQASEHMGIDLTAYCYLRGWRAYQKYAGPLLLEKCCHDIDIINWLLGSPCKWVAAAGGRTAFVPRSDAPERCRDCRDAECVYRHYGTRPLTDASGERIYGADAPADDWCVYNRAKDIDDHTSVLSEYEGGTHVVFNVTMGVARGERRIRIVGTKGVIAGCAEDNTIEFLPLKRDAQPEVIKPPRTGSGGHFGGDSVLAADFVRLATDPSARTEPSIPDCYKSGMICLAADEAERTGRRVAVAEFEARS